MTSYCRAPVNFTAHQRPMVGDTKTSVVPSDHIGWMKCNGRMLAVSEYYQLWRVIGYSFGGSGDMFMLPDAQGRVPGFVGTGIDTPYNSSFTFALGDTPGEYRHQLTIAEMPTHNHGVDGAPQPTNNQTSSNATGISINLSTTGVYDSGHAHTYLGVSGQGVLGGTLDTAADEVNRPTETTGSNSANIVDPGHIHSIADPTHFHTINAAGGSNFHMNIQPTIVIGNMFIYSGKPNTPMSGFPYTENTQIL